MECSTSAFRNYLNCALDTFVFDYEAIITKSLIGVKISTINFLHDDFTFFIML